MVFRVAEDIWLHRNWGLSYFSLKKSRKKKKCVWEEIFYYFNVGTYYRSDPAISYREWLKSLAFKECSKSYWKTAYKMKFGFSSSFIFCHLPLANILTKNTYFIHKIKRFSYKHIMLGRFNFLKYVLFFDKYIWFDILYEFKNKSLANWKISF